MIATPSSTDGKPKLRPKSNRKPLQPKNFLESPIGDRITSKPMPEWIEISLVGNSGKENHSIWTTPTKIEPFDASLAEELSAIRKRLERLRSEKEKTEKMLRERDLVLETQMRELEKRGEAQKKVQIEVEKLQRLKKLHSSSMRILPTIQSMREKERGKKINEAPVQEQETLKSMENEIVADVNESVEKGLDRSPCVDIK